jgi:Domain of unknown function (DUF4878)
MRRVAFSLPAAASCALALGVLVSCANMFEKSPSAVVQAFLAAANEGRYSDAQEMLSEGARNVYVNSERGQGAGGIRGICDQITKNGSIAKVVIVKEEIRGEGAVVTADVTFKDGSSVKGDQNPIPLMKEEGAWKLTLGPAPSSPVEAAAQPAPQAAPEPTKSTAAVVAAPLAPSFPRKPNAPPLKQIALGLVLSETTIYFSHPIDDPSAMLTYPKGTNVGIFEKEPGGWYRVDYWGDAPNADTPPCPCYVRADTIELQPH